MSRAKELLAEAFGGQARWRSEKAGAYPDDERNLRSAAGLDHLAEYVVSLSDTDDRVRELATLVVNLEANVAHFGQRASHQISRFRFNDPDEDCDTFLSRLVPVVVEDQVDMLNLSGVLDREARHGTEAAE